jgi:hypothetical protein
LSTVSNLILTIWNHDWTPASNQPRILLPAPAGGGYFFASGIAFDKAARPQALDCVLPSPERRARGGRRRESGAARKGKSLLPPGIARCEGEFASGDVVRICDRDGTEFARGITDLGWDIRGRKLQRVEVVHRDNLVIL